MDDACKRNRRLWVRKADCATHDQLTTRSGPPQWAGVAQQRLDDKSIVIVGGTSGLGLSAAFACAAEGARLVLVGLDEAECEQASAQVVCRR